tara:strand:+ start:800 stop:913 length:114 start_codon:yes stop_codon:yes gene_type:complete
VVDVRRMSGLMLLEKSNILITSTTLLLGSFRAYEQKG